MFIDFRPHAAAPWRWLQNYLTAPEDDVKESLCLFRMLWSGFYLFFIWSRENSDLVIIPADQWNPVRLLVLLGAKPPGWVVVATLVSICTAALIGVLLGYQTKLSTMLIFVFGTLLFAYRNAFEAAPSHGHQFLFIYVPAIMMFSEWGCRYSIDSWVKRPLQLPSWRYVWPLHLITLIFAVLYFFAGYNKVVWDYGSYYFTNPQQIQHLFTRMDIKAALFGYPKTGIASFLAHDVPVAHHFFRYGIVIVEIVTPIALVNRKLRSAMFSSLMFFHWTAAIILHVYFVNAMIQFSVFLPLFKYRRIFLGVIAAALSLVIGLSFLFRPSDIYEIVRMWAFWLASPFILWVLLRSYWSLGASVFGGVPGKIEL